MSTYYPGYSVDISIEDSKASVHYDASARGQLTRFTFILFRIPSQKRFLVRFFHDATDEDRKLIESKLHLQGLLFFHSRHLARRDRRSDGTYAFSIYGGALVDDPLVQLELEMMIDLTSGVSA